MSLLIEYLGDIWERGGQVLCLQAGLSFLDSSDLSSSVVQIVGAAGMYQCVYTTF